MFFADQNIQEVAKTEIVQHKKTNVSYYFATSKAGILAGVIKIPPKDSKIPLYNELPRTIEDEKKIEDIVTTLGLNGKMDLLMHHQKRLTKIGDEVRYVHPLKFCRYIFSKPDLKAHMAVVFEDYFKRTSFVKDFAKTMDVYDLKNQLKMYLDDFSKEVNVPADKLLPYIDNKDWEGFLKFLIKY